MLSAGDVLVGDAVEVLDQGAQAVAVRGDEHDLAVAEVGHDLGLPVGQEPCDDVLEALGAGHLVTEVGVARVAHLGELVVVRDGRRRGVEGAAPEHELLLAVLLERLLLVLALQGAVVALVEAPGALDGDPVPVGRVERQARGGDGASLQRGVHDVRAAGRPHRMQLAAAHRLGPALLGQVDVDPAGEEVLGVPVALAVAEQDQGVRHGWISSVGGGISARTRTRTRSPRPGAARRRGPRSSRGCPRPGPRPRCARRCRSRARPRRSHPPRTHR